MTEETGPLDMSAEEFRTLGHHLVERIAGFLETARERPASVNLSPAEARRRVGQGPLPERGADPRALIDEAADLLFDGCRFNGHPRSWGYVIGSPAPIGMLADFLASAVNPNLAAWASAPLPTEIELQAVRWIAELLGYPSDCGGLLTSGGNAANFIGFLAARRARAGWDLGREGLAAGPARLRVYASPETHTWLDKAADLFGLGREAIRWVATDGDLRMDAGALETQIAADLAAGERPFLIVGSAGTVSTGAVDPLPDMAAIARRHGLWLHVDGAYGAPAVLASEAPAELQGLREADSIAIDAHKWLCVPLEAGCALVRDRQELIETFAHRPDYYHYGTGAAEEITHFHELGPQNSRGFRALKVWLALRAGGRAAYTDLVSRNIRQARALYRLVAAAPELEAATQNLSITTFRYRPEALDRDRDGVEDYLHALNAELVLRIQKGGEAHLSNAVVDGRFLLRACITNFRSTDADVDMLPGLVVRLGRELDAEMRPADLRGETA